MSLKEIIGGAIGEFDWGYLFVDTVWVADNKRGKGHATHIMQAIEGYAHSRGIQRAYLTTTTFQARPFYEKIGYQVFGELQNHPPQHTAFYLYKDRLQTNPTNLEVQSPPHPLDLTYLNQALVDDIARHVPLDMTRYAIFLHDDEGTIQGGLWGHFYWDWFDLRFLWMSETVRGKGYAKQAMNMLFNECQQRACVGIKSDTAGFQALGFYQALGFEIFATLQHRPPNHTSYFIKTTF